MTPAAKRVPVPRVRDVPLRDLKLNSRNPRRITPERLEDLKGSLASDAELLACRPVIALADGTVIAGNMRLRAALELGWETIPTVVVELDPKRARLWMLKDNQGYGDWVDDQLAELLAELACDGVDLSLSGFPASEIDRLLDELTKEQTPVDPDDVPERPAPKTKPGNLWTLGDHRVLCGDATDANSYERLLGDHRVGMVWTDPPYGVDYEGKTKEGLRIQNDTLSATAQKKLLARAFGLALERCRKGAVFYVTAPSSPPHLNPFVSLLEELGILKQTLVWVKDSFVLGRADFHYRHELILYGWATGRHRAPPDRSHDTVWEVPRARASRDHPTQKPVALIERALTLSSTRKDVVLDPFVGSGSSVIAAERLGRRCYGIEIDPRYVDVTLARFEAVTGIRPQKQRRR